MKENITIEKLLPGVKKNIPLKEYTTFKIGGPAKYFYIVKNNNDLGVAFEAIKILKLPFFILSGGSNILFSDKGFNGLVILIKCNDYKILKTKVFTNAGVDFSLLVRKTIELGLSGFEWAGGLPGSVGGAVRGNAGAFGKEIKDILFSVEFLDNKGNIKKFNNKQCKFGYRNSIFKNKNWIILSATFKVKQGNKKDIQKIAKSHIMYRKKRHPLEYPNAGSVFKNCDLKKFSPELKKTLKNVVKIDPFPVVPTAYLISEAKLKGLRVGQAQVSEKHPNYIVNLGGASSKDVLLLIKKVKKEIRKKYKVDIEEEIKIF